MHIASRRIFELDGEWDFEIDPFDHGLGQRVWEGPELSPDGPALDIDVGSFRKVRVPQDWNRQYSELAYYEGPAWYHRKVERPAGWAGKRAFVHFEGANRHATVYWNGVEIGSHDGGYSPFEFEVTGKLVAENTLTLRVDDARSRDVPPGDAFDWFNYGGILRRAWLVLAPRTFIKDFAVTTTLGKKRVARIDFEVVGARKGARARVLLPQLEREYETNLGEGGRASATIDLDGVNLWSPDHPHLYRVEIASEGDRIAEDIGFRSIEVKGSSILLNGQPIFLRGVSVQEESPRTAGRSVSRRDMDYVFKTARSLGLNFLRLAHFPHSDEFARMADAEGFLIWQDLPVGSGVDFKSRPALENAQQALRAMIERDRNRASVAFWSVAAETPRTPERNKFLKALASSARKLDPSRPVGAVTEAEVKGRNVLVNDPLASDLGVIGVSQFLGEDDTPPDQIAKHKLACSIKKPVIAIAFGASAKAGLAGKANQRWTEEHQAAVYQGQLDMIEKARFVCGASPAYLFDFRSPLRMNRHQQGYNRQGLLSDQGVRKQAFTVLKDRYEKWKKLGK